jgi:hypothetical protein
MWLDIVPLASIVVLKDEEDELVWKFSSNGIYNSQSLHRIINFRGVVPVHVPRIWELHIPPRVHLWLLFKNKVLTRDNVAIRQHVDNKTCLFCAELETSQDIFFECVVAKRMWSEISNLLGRQIGLSFDNWSLLVEYQIIYCS